MSASGSSSRRPLGTESAVSAWADSGCAWLTGHRHGPPLDGPRTLAAGVAQDFGRLQAATAGWSTETVHPFAGVEPMELLGERAALAGLARAGRRSCGGGARLLRCTDGWIAVNLSRPTDLELLPAWLGDAQADMSRIDVMVHHRSAEELVEQGMLLGMAVSRLGEAAAGEPVRHLAQRPGPARVSAPRVVDLSSLWAGPLCSSLLAAAGADVIKVESSGRPDGLRRDPSGFFDLLNAGKRSVVLDFADRRQVDVLRDLLASADVVIEASRPRALEQLGIDANDMVSNGGPPLWLSITAHGRVGAGAARIGFGDDVAVAAGLVAWDRDDEPVFLADAVADPLTGIGAAAAVARAWVDGDTGLIDVAMARVAAVAATGVERPTPELADDGVGRPRSRTISSSAAGLGADTDEVLAELR